jgi:hypothetical protein
MAEFRLNIFGTTNDDLDGSSGSGFKREFVLHIISVTSDISVTNFDMFLQYYAYPWDLIPLGGRASNVNGGALVDRIPNSRPQVIHLDTMSPSVFPTLEADCITFPAGGGSCPNPEDIRIFSMAHGVPIDASPSGYDSDETNMEDINLELASLPVDITIIADNCRYSGNGNINIYKDYSSAGDLFGGTTANPDSKVIGQDEIIIIN